jgi:hypothetical protein
LRQNKKKFDKSLTIFASLFADTAKTLSKQLKKQQHKLLQRLYYFGIEFAGAGVEAAGAAGLQARLGQRQVQPVRPARLSITPPLTLLAGGW